MKPFDIQECLNDIYACYPEAEHRPLIGSPGTLADADPRHPHRT